MKKVISLLAAALLVVCLAACDADKAVLNEHNNGVAQEVITAADSYLAGELSQEEAGAAIVELYESIDIDENGGVGYGSVDRALFQKHVKSLIDELLEAGDNGRVQEYRDSVAGFMDA